MVDPGELRHFLNIEVETGTIGRGNLKSYATAVSNVPAKITELAGRRAEIARQLVGSATHEITIRFYNNLDLQHRFNFEGKIFNVGQIQDVDLLHWFQVCLCTSQETGG